MAIANTVQNFLDRQHVNYQLVQHPYMETAKECAEAAHIPPHRMAKAVVLKDDDGFVMAVVPSDRDVDVDAVNLRMNRLLMTADQRDVRILFRDCARGAVPALGQAYNMPLIWDDELTQEPDCYLEAGDHTSLIYMSRHDFMNLMGDRPHGSISH